MNTEKTRVLLIENQSSDVNWITSLLDSSLPVPGVSGFEIMHARTLEIGLHLLAKETTDVVLVDLGLSDSQSLEPIWAVQRQAPNLPLVILANQDDFGLAFRAAQEGVQDFIVKGRIEQLSLTNRLNCAIARKHREVALTQANDGAGTEVAALTVELNEVHQELSNVRQASQPA